MMRKLIRNEAIMKRNSNKTLKDASPYSAVLTREQFLFYETRITAKLLEEGLSREEVINRIVAENLFQYPTEKSIRRMNIQMDSLTLKLMDYLWNDAKIMNNLLGLNIHRL